VPSWYVASRDEHWAGEMSPRPVRRQQGRISAQAGPSISYGYKCVKAMNALVLLSCNCQRRSVLQVDNATVESGNNSVTELAHHQQRTAVMPTPCVMSLFFCALMINRWSRAGPRPVLGTHFELPILPIEKIRRTTQHLQIMVVWDWDVIVSSN